MMSLSFSGVWIQGWSERFRESVFVVFVFWKLSIVIVDVARLHS